MPGSPPDHPGPADSAIRIIAVTLVLVSTLIMMGHLRLPFLFDWIWHLPRLFDGTWESPLSRIAKALALGLPVIICDFSIGYCLISILSRPKRLLTPLESLFVAPLIGGVILSWIILCMGLAGYARQSVYLPLIITIFICVPAGLFSIKSRWLPRGSFLSGIHHAFRQLPGAWGFCGVRAALCLVPLLIILGLAVPYIFSPEVESDAARYHLAAPAQWLQLGKIHYLPYQAFSNFPMLGEMHFMAALTGDGESGRLIHFAWLFICLGLITTLFRMFNKRKNRDRLSLLPAMGFLLIPSVPILGAWCFIDMFMTAYFLGFVLIAGISLKRGFSWSLALIQTFCIGGCISTKYTMLPLVGILGIIWMVLTVLNRNPRDTGVASGCLRIIMTGIGGLVMGSIWYLRNACWTGNPFYPLAWGVFRGGEWSGANAEFYMNRAASKGVITEGYSPFFNQLIELILTPYRTVFHFDAFESHILGLIPLFGWILTLSLLCSILLERKRKSLKRYSRPYPFPRILLTWLYASILVSWVFWFFTYQSNRLLLPTLALVLISGCIAINHFRLLEQRDTTGQIFPALFRITLIVSMAMNLLIFCGIMLGEPVSGEPWKREAIRTGLGFQNPEIYKSLRLNYYPAAMWCGENIGKDERILIVGEHRTLYFGTNVIASDWFDTPQPLPWIRKSVNFSDMLDQMAMGNINYILLNRGELGLYHGPEHIRRGTDLFRPRFTADEFARFKEIWTKPELESVREFRGRKLSVFRVNHPKQSNVE